MRHCSVPGCGKKRPMKDTTNTLPDGKVGLHSFPQDRLLRRKWLKFLNQPTSTDTSKMLLCSKHFDPSCFHHHTGIEAVMDKTWRQKLRPDAIPTLKCDLGAEAQNSKRRKRLDVINLKRELSAMKTQYSQSKSQPETSSAVEQPSASSDPSTEMDTPFPRSSTDVVNVLQQEVEELRILLDRKNEQLEQCQSKLSSNEERIDELEKLNADLTTVYKHNVLQDARAILAKKYTSNQIDIMLGLKEKPREWTAEELSMGFTLKYLSKPGLDYVTGKLNFPLPSASCLIKHASKINLRKGFFHEVLQLLKAWGATQSERNKICVLLYDEVSVARAYEYDRSNGDVLHPSSKMQVIMMRGLFGSWKQPIFADFDVNATKELLDEAIMLAWEAGFECVALVSDCGGGNQKVWSHINLDEERTFLLHPGTGGKVYLIADPPHTLKLVRNWLFDNGFHLEGGIFIPPVDGGELNPRANPLWQLIAKENVEISDTFFLTEELLTVETSQRQNVAMAAKIFSRKCGTALLRRVGTDLAKDLADFIFTVNDYFDIFNSRNLNNSINMKKPYGTDLDLQNAALDKMYNLMKTTIPGGKAKPQVFQRAIMMSIISLKALYKDMRERFGTSFIMCAKLNQDALENLFSLLRARARTNDHRTPLNALRSLRVIMLGKNLVSLSPGQNTVDQCDEKFAVLEVLRTMKKSAQPNDSVHFESIDVELDTEQDIDFQDDFITEKDGFEYIVGAMCRKFKNQFPHIGSFSYETPGMESLLDHDYAFPQSYVQHLSLGGLTKPSEEWLAQAKNLEVCFKAFHRKSISKASNVCQKLSNILKGKYPTIPPVLIEHFIRHRTYVRINTLNRILKAKQFKKKIVKRLAKPIKTPCTTKQKKMKKLLM